jgi:hypothetical protein
MIIFSIFLFSAPPHCSPVTLLEAGAEAVSQGGGVWPAECRRQRGAGRCGVKGGDLRVASGGGRWARGDNNAEGWRPMALRGRGLGVALGQWRAASAVAEGGVRDGGCMKEYCAAV